MERLGGFIGKSQSLLEKLRYCLRSISIYTITLVCLSEAQTKTTFEMTDTGKDDIIDEELTNYLTETRAINWCRTTNKMAALKINSRGRSSLLKAVSKTIWAVDDRDVETFLQQLMDMNLSSARESARFKERWENEIGIKSKTNNSVKFSSWEEVCRAFKDTNGVWDERTGDVDCIHIYTLANVIKRPIVVIETDVDDDETNGGLGGLGGLYLPSLLDPDQCFKSPIVLASRNGRFSPVVVRPEARDHGRQTPRIKAVPLVTHRFEQLLIRNLADEENQRRGFALLKDYLKVEEIPCTGPSALNLVLTARLIGLKPELQDVGERESRSNGKFSETYYTQIKEEGKNMRGVGGYTAVLLENSGLRCSDPLCNHPIDPEYYPKCRKHGMSEIGPSSKNNDEDLIRENPELIRIEANELRNFARAIPEKCVVNQCRRAGVPEYDGKCSYCYVIGTEFCANEPAETYESGGLKSSEELAREERNRELSEKGRDRSPLPFYSGTKRGDELAGTRYERQTSDQPKCTAPICRNQGLSTYNGLCIECFNAIWKSKGIRANIAEVTGPAWTVRPSESTRFVATKAKCLTEGCHHPVDNQDLGLCKTCSSQQRQFLEAFERQKQAVGSQPPASPGPRWQTPSETSGLWYPSGEPSLQGHPLPGQQKLLGLSSTNQRLGTSFYSRPEVATRAKMCLSSSCDRFGDPGYGGFCSQCYVRRN